MSTYITVCEHCGTTLEVDEATGFLVDNGTVTNLCCGVFEGEDPSYDDFYPDDDFYDDFPPESFEELRFD